MKNYELIAELMKLPAGYEVCFGKTIVKEDFIDEQDSIFAGGNILDIQVDEGEGIIELLN